MRFALEAADAGRVVAVPGARNKVMAVAGQLAPRAWVRRLAGRIGLKYIGYDAGAAAKP